MTYLNEIPLRNLQFYLTAPYPCSYLPDETARSEVATPHHLINGGLYSELIEMGFRRSGVYTYRPHCDYCRACIPLRVEVGNFLPNRAQRRAWKRHRQLDARVMPLVFQPEHYALYRRYQSERHPDGGMDHDSKAQYCQFLLESGADTQLVEFSEGGKLMMVGIMDMVRNGISSVYTFYEQGVPRASFGTYSILWQIERCRELGLPYLYLGYWIAQSPKMSYKINFQPAQGLLDGRWEPLAAKL